MERAILLALTALILSGLPACNDTSPEHGGRIRAVCSAEIDKLCAGEDRIGRCLRKQMDELSESCKAGLGERRGEGKGAR